MNPADPDVLVIGGDTRTQRVKIADTVYTLRPMTAPQIEAFVRLGGPELVNAVTGLFAGESAAAPNWPALVQQHEADLRHVLAACSEIPAEVIAALNGAELIQLTDVVMELNLDFFVQRVRPALGRLLMTVSRIARRASPATSPTASRH